jgi:hypothetical protein
MDRANCDRNAAKKAQPNGTKSFSEPFVLTANA